MDNKLIFISHSSQDTKLVKSLVKLLNDAFSLQPAEILCTSLPGYSFELGANTDESLRAATVSSITFIAVLTPASMESPYVTFELGARWGTNAHFAPMIANGLAFSELKPPLGGLNAIDATDVGRLHDMLDGISRAIGRSLRPASVYFDSINELAEHAALTDSSRAQSKTNRSPFESRPIPSKTISASEGAITTLIDSLKSSVFFNVKSNGCPCVAISIYASLPPEIEEVSYSVLCSHDLPLLGYADSLPIDKRRSGNARVFQSPKSAIGSAAATVIYPVGLLQAAENDLLSCQQTIEPGTTIPNSATGMFKPRTFELAIIKFVHECLRAMTNNCFLLPASVNIAIVGANGLWMPNTLAESGLETVVNPISDARIGPVSVRLNDLSQISERMQMANVLKPIFDYVWQAFGFDNCWSYTDDGLYRHRDLF